MELLVGVAPPHCMTGAGPALECFEQLTEPTPGIEPGLAGYEPAVLVAGP